MRILEAHQFAEVDLIPKILFKNAMCATCKGLLKPLSCFRNCVDQIWLAYMPADNAYVLKSHNIAWGLSELLFSIPNSFTLRKAALKGLKAWIAAWCKFSCKRYLVEASFLPVWVSRRNLSTTRLECQDVSPQICFKRGSGSVPPSHPTGWNENR